MLQVSKSFQGKRGDSHLALDGVSLDIASGEMMTIVGPSGAGKSSLLRMISGLDEPTQGHVLLGEKRVLAIPPAEREIFFLFQDALLYPGLSVFDNLALPLKRKRTSKAKMVESIRSSAGRFQISDRLESFPEVLSSGERQRVALARAILSEPKLLLLDEPLSALEPELRYKLKREIVDLRERKGTTIVSVTHDPFEAFTLGDRVAVMQKGRLLQVDVPDLVYRYPTNKFVAGFIGNPPMNFLCGKVASSDRGLRFEVEHDPGRTAGLTIALPPTLIHLLNRQLVVGIRPEHIGVHLGERRDGMSFDAAIERIECFEDATFLTLRCFDLFLVARVRGERYNREMGSVKMTIDSSNLVWFDGVSMDRVGLNE
ncbi:ABC transporter ATP-binding protein [Verrucomicrobia bacterium]|nr:ABC transporter ATP-binding protein [Verrucomicrobiota bacterium]